MTTRLAWLDGVRGVAAILVVLLHTSAPYLYKIKIINPTAWMAGNVIDSFTRISVPLFFMVSGYLFFSDKSPKWKNFIRVLTALIFYSLISLIYLKFCRDSSVLGLITGMASKPVFYHLWFFYSLLPIYVFGMLLKIRNIDKTKTLVLAVVCFVFLNPHLSNLTEHLGLIYKSRITIDGTLVYYFLYALFGALLGRLKFSSTSVNLPILLTITYLVTSLLICYLTFIASSQAGKYIGTYYHYNGPLVAIGAISVFLLIKEYHHKCQFLIKPMGIIARYSLPIYGVHAVILDYFYRAGYRDFSNPLVDIPVVFTAVIVLSLLFGFLVKKIDNNNYIS